MSKLYCISGKGLSAQYIHTHFLAFSLNTTELESNFALTLNESSFRLAV